MPDTNRAAGATTAPQERAITHIALGCTLLALSSLLAPTAGALASPSRTLSVYDEGHLRWVRSSGNQVIDEGQANGTMPGRVIVNFTYNGSPTVYASFTIYTHGGSIRGNAKGKLSNPTSTSPSFRGALTLSGGAGRYTHARGSGELFGVYYRRSYGMTVQTRGHLQY